MHDQKLLLLCTNTNEPNFPAGHKEPKEVNHVWDRNLSNSLRASWKCEGIDFPQSSIRNSADASAFEFTALHILRISFYKQEFTCRCWQCHDPHRLTDDGTCTLTALSHYSLSNGGPHLPFAVLWADMSGVSWALLSSGPHRGKKRHPEVSCKHPQGEANPNSSSSHRASDRFWNRTPAPIQKRSSG